MKKYKNEAEQRFAEQATSHGWVITKCGYPDFICYLPDGDIVLVEVKKKHTHPLKKSQSKFMNAVKDKIKCYKWTLDDLKLRPKTPRLLKAKAFS